MNYTISPLKPFGVLVEPSGEKINAKDIDVEVLRDWFSRNSLVLLRGFNTFENSDEFAAYCELWGQISIWPFGKVLELIEQENPGDHIFDSNYVPLHWDGMYRPQIPEYQIFHCVKPPLPGHGGRTTFSNTIMALENASTEEREQWSKVTGNYKRKMEFYDSNTVSPIMTKHPFKDLTVIRYNEPPSEDDGNFLNPPELQFSGVNNEDLTGFHSSLKKKLYDSANFYAHEWQAGDIVIADNFSLLHGREGFVSKSPRHIQRVHVLSNPPLDNPGLESYR